MMRKDMDRGFFIMRPCALRDVQVVEARSCHKFARHTHDRYGIGLIVAGAHRSWSGRGMVEAGRGDLITCNPGEVHDGMSIGGARAWKMLYLAQPLVAAIVTDIREGAGADFEFADPVIKRRAKIQTFQAAYITMTDRCAAAGRAQERLILLLAGLLYSKPPLSAGVPPDLARANSTIL